MFGFLVLLSYCLASADGHGYLLEPVARSSAWLVDPSFRQCCTWPQHMEMFCGGLGHQWNVNGGKCSICGEPYDKPVKVFEKGGAMYRGTTVQTYTQGQQIDVKVVLTANHKGYFEFRLCNLDASPAADASQECLDRHLLKIANSDSTKFRDVHQYGSEMITVRVQLPSDVACRHCVFQWKYTAGNSWGTDSSTGQSGAGLGKENETFMGCSDIAILANGSPTNPPMVIIPTASTTTIRTSATNSQGTASSSHWSWSSTSPSTWWSTNPPTWWSASPSTWSSTNPSTWWPTNPPTLSSTTQSVPSTTTTSARPLLGLTTWSAELFDYQIGDEVMYDGLKYRCIAPHRSYPGAEPGVLTWAWWERVKEGETPTES